MEKSSVAPVDPPAQSLRHAYRPRGVTWRSLDACSQEAPSPCDEAGIYLNEVCSSSVHCRTVQIDSADGDVGLSVQEKDHILLLLPLRALG